jgi:hypothetical protein
VDWYDVVLRKFAPQSQYNVNVRGGTKTARYFVSSGYFHQEGLFNTDLNSDFNTNFQYNRFNFRTNLDLDVSHKLTLSLNIAARIEDTNEPGNTGYTGGEIQSAFQFLSRMPPYETPVFQRNGKPGVGGMGVNPWLRVNGYGYTRNQTDVLESSLLMNYDLSGITRGLKFRSLVSYDSSFSEQKRFTQNTAVYRLDSAPGEEDSYTVIGEDTRLRYDGGSQWSYRKVYAEAALTFDRQFGKNSLTGLLLGNIEDKQYGGNYIPFRYIGIVGRITYDFDTRYLAEINMGYNGSENFARGNRFGFFPSFSAGWVLSNEAFLSSSEFVDLLKIRASFGSVGNDKIGGSRFMYMEEYNTRNSWDALSLPFVWELRCPGKYYHLNKNCQSAPHLGNRLQIQFWC